jgi:hypothetical protein
MEANGDNLIIGGTYHGEHPFNNEITTELASTPFMASVKKADGAINWVYTGDSETAATCMTIADAAIIASTDASITSIDLTTGTATTTATTQTILCADKNIVVYTDDTEVCISASATTADIEEVITEQQAEVRYNLAGQVVDKNYKGFVIANGKKLFVK